MESYSSELKEEIEKLTKALIGIASCATQCPCCEMHRRIANKALGHEVDLTYTVIIVPRDKASLPFTREVATLVSAVRVAELP
jgi:hypothetical protein